MAVVCDVQRVVFSGPPPTLPFPPSPLFSAHSLAGCSRTHTTYAWAWHTYILIVHVEWFAGVAAWSD